VTITASSNLSKGDIDKAVKEAEQFAAEDKKRREEIDVRNQGDQTLYQTEKTLNDLGGKLSDGDSAPVRAALDALRDSLKTDNFEDIKQKTEALTKAFYAVSEKLYAGAAAPGGDTPPQSPGGPQDAPGSGPVVDADYEVLDKE
jgi:molecular chaperone DnaK